ncbi:hypothetical protein [Streptomyces sp. CB01881]|uniref:hypothetical protein n=1 Tax=Streptomyces sp. CB01881 TaxID=2078691 RepID=UPI001386CF4A|nr:hypothetical protein [Streptomyces sp. CB01881]
MTEKNPAAAGIDASSMEIEWHTTGCASSPSNEDSLTFNVAAVGISSDVNPGAIQCARDARQQAIPNPVSASQLQDGVLLRKGVALCLETKGKSILHMKITGSTKDGWGNPDSFTFSASLWKKST